MLALARTACVDEMRGYEQREHLNMGNAFSVAPAQLDALLLPVTDMAPVRFPAPLFIGTGRADHTIPPHRQFAGVAALCAAGNPLVWNTYAGMTHNGTVNAAFEDELRFVRAVFAGQPEASNCSALADPGAPGTAQAGIRFND
jgi:hypothetical protein